MTPSFRQIVVDMTRWVVQRCVIGANGSGGFATRGLAALIDYSLTESGIPSTYRKHTLFIYHHITSSPSKGWS